MTPVVALSAVRRPNRFEEISWAVVAVTIAIAIGLLEPRTGLTLIVAATISVATLFMPAIGIAILVATVPIQNAWPAQIGMTSLTWTKLALCSFLVAWFVRLALGRERLRMTTIAWAMSAFCLALIVSVIHARDTAGWVGEVYRWVVAAAVYVAAASSLRRTRDRWLVLIALATGILGSLMVAIYQVITNAGPESFDQRGILRAYGLFGEPNPFAGFLEMATLPLLAVGFSMVRRRRRDTTWWSGVFALAGGAAGVLALVLTQSRGGALGFAAGLVVIAWFLWPQWGRVIVTGGACVALLVVWAPPAAGIRSVLGMDALLGDGPRQVTPGNFATEERLAHWGAAWRMWEYEPWLGIGAGNFSERFREFTPEWRFRISRGHAHSAYLQAAAQAGVVGLGWYLALLGTAWGRFRRSLARAATAESNGFRVAALAVTAAVAVHGVFEYVHVLSLGIALSAIWALPEGECLPRMDESTNHGLD